MGSQLTVRSSSRGAVMRSVAALATLAALALATPAAAVTKCQNNLKQLALGIVYEVDFLAFLEATPEAFDEDSAVLHIRKSGCGSDCATLDVTYFTLAAGGGLSIADDTGVQFAAFGEQLFTGSTARPTLRLGTFTFERSRDGNPLNAVLSVTPVPEPASWALMIIGFGLAGGSLRRRARAGATA